MKLNKFTYFYPEKPRLITKDQSLFQLVSENSDWVAEKKYNGSRLQLHHINGNFHFWNRHNNKMAYTPTSEIINYLNSLNLPTGYNLFDGELRHNKVVGVRNKIILYDVFIWNGEVLLNKSFFERRKLLESILNVESEPIGITKQYKTDFFNLFNNTIKEEELEGLVIKKMFGKLNLSRTRNQESNWMLKVRKETNKHRF